MTNDILVGVNGEEHLPEILHIPSYIHYIDDFAFAQCLDIQEVIFEGNIESIGKGAFLSCENLLKVRFNDTVKRIGDCAFARTKLRSIDLSSCIKVEEGAFSECYLEDIVLPENLENIEENIFTYQKSWNGYKYIVFQSKVNHEILEFIGIDLELYIVESCDNLFFFGQMMVKKEKKL